MDATKPVAYGFLKTAYAHDQHKPLRRSEPFHLGAWFDVAVVVILLITVVGYLTA